MATLNDTRFVERIQFFDGQRLLAPDLQALETFNREMRWLHNQTLHQPGIGSGYAVHGKKGDREVTVAPGYALDALGREIVLTRDRRLPVPPVAGAGNGRPSQYDLAVAYPSDEDLKPTETREGVCLTQGVVRLREEPVFCWIPLGKDGQPIDTNLKVRVRDGLFIVLARVAIANCQLEKPVSTVQRRNARPPKQPHIACGVASPTWEWKPANNFLVLLAAAVDTRCGGFATAPSYWARLRGNVGLKYPHFLLGAAIAIEDARATGFEIQALLMRAGGLEGLNETSTFSNLKVVWMGVEA
jgi:hypothetical protein